MRRHLRLVLNVSFDGDRPYYLDDELVGVVTDELASLQHIEDGPRTTVIASKITRVTDDEWDPKPGNQLLDHNSPEHKAAEIWQWIINANNGLGSDVGDLMATLERHGIPCPGYMDDC